MDDGRPNSSENPLDELASELSDALNSKSVDVSDISTDRVEGGQIRMDGSVARSVHGQAIHMEGSAAGLLKAEVVELDDSIVGLLNANHASIEEIISVGLIAKDVRAKSIFSIIFLAGRVEGDVRAVFTPRTALAAGAGLGLALFVSKRILLRLWPFRRRNPKTKSG